MMAALTGRHPAIMEWLQKTKILVDDKQLVTRVLIDIKPSDIVKVYLEMAGSSEVFDLTPPDLSGAEITRLESQTDA